MCVGREWLQFIYTRTYLCKTAVLLSSGVLEVAWIRKRSLVIWNYVSVKDDREKNAYKLARIQTRHTCVIMWKIISIYHSPSWRFQNRSRSRHSPAMMIIIGKGSWYSPHRGGTALIRLWGPVTRRTELKWIKYEMYEWNL